MFDVLEVDEEEIISIADVQPRKRCPKCNSRRLKTSTVPETDNSYLGAALYALTQTCIMCGWDKTYFNVKLGV